MIKVKLLISIVLMALIVSPAFSQVTIGSQYKPVDGAVLQLKENDNVGSNSTRGLLLPRVELTNKFSFEPIGTTADAEEHIGMMVYNVNAGIKEPTSACDPTPSTLSITKGLKVWMGHEWGDLGNGENDNIIPPEWISDDVKFIKDHEGNIYPVRQFGDEGYWLLENLRTKTIPSGRAKYMSQIGTSLLEITDYEKVKNFKKAHYQYPSPPNEYKPYFGEEQYPPITDDTFFKKYPNVGLLYNYFLALNDEEPAETEDRMNGTFLTRYPKQDANGRPISFIQGICPDGWHVPYNEEFDNLFLYIKTHFEAGDQATSGVDLTFQSENNISIPRLPLTNCLPLGTAENNRGASLIALKGGFAGMWVGADSPYRSTQTTTANDKIGPKEYGVLAVFCTVYGSRRVGATSEPANVNEDWVGNYWIRPARPGINDDDWVSGKAYKTNMYPVRCKKNDNTDSGLLEYEDVISK